MANAVRDYSDSKYKIEKLAEEIIRSIASHCRIVDNRAN